MAKVKTKGAATATQPSTDANGTGRKRSKSENRYVVGYLFTDDTGRLQLSVLSKILQTVGQARRLRETMRDMGATHSKDAKVIRIRIAPEKEPANAG